jgi:hypothetical protein
MLYTRHAEFFRQQLEFPYFSRYSLANIFQITEEQVLDRFLAERWKGVNWSEAGYNRFGHKDTRLYSAKSMPYETRLELVTGLTDCLEEGMGPLLLSADWEARLFCEIFKKDDAETLRAAAYRSAQLQYVQVAARELRLTDYDAASAVAAGFGIAPEIFFCLMEEFSTTMFGFSYPNPNTLLDMSADLRFAALLWYCEHHSPAILLSEFPTEKAAVQ